MTVSIAITVAFTAAYLALAVKLVWGFRPTTRDLCLGGVVIALTLILESIRIPLPIGATVPLLSPVPLMALALIWDKRLAIGSGWICGVLGMFLVAEWAPVHWGQFFVEHLISISCCGFVAVFGTDRKWKVLLGLVLASALKILSHVLSGVLFFSQNAWDGWGAWAYSLGYNLTQNGILCLLSALVILALPLGQLRRVLRKE